MIQRFTAASYFIYRCGRYIPAVDEQVIGVVLETHAENLNVDVGGPFPAALSVLAFEVRSRAWRHTGTARRSVKHFIRSISDCIASSAFLI
jgi:exosome complex RNA-binding protein Rrp4